MSARLPGSVRHRECEPAVDPYTRKRPFALALRQLLEGRAPGVAARIHLSARLVEAWENAFDPQRSPLQTLSDTIEAALALGATREDAAQVVELLARQIGYRLERVEDVTRESLGKTVAEASREVGEGLAVALETMEDGEVDDLEHARARRELSEARDRLARVERALDTANLKTRTSRAARASARA